MLSVIIGYTQMALQQTDPESTLHHDLQEVLSAANRSTGITRQLLAFARKQTLNPQVLDLNETVKGMINMLRQLIGEDITLRWKPSPDLWPVMIDPSQLDQVLANLCVNARDAISGVGDISIETGMISFEPGDHLGHVEVVPGDYLFLLVNDSGCGMDKEILDRIFDPFFTTKEVGHGTGLGLSTVYGIVKQHNGFVDVDSEPDKGSIFRIYLPCYLGDAGQAEIQLNDTVRNGQGQTILVVDDELAILKLTSRMLKTLGYEVLTADSPNEAISLAQKQVDGIHLLLTDVIMPEMNGQALAERVLAIHPGLKYLFMSGYTANVIENQGGLDVGSHLIQKPFTAKELAAKVREFLAF
jgi:two-component system sensor histidine kinase EvgS